ncbi:hypothetical protein WY02_15370 [Pseudonocardia sp. AL041005-10]|nr:hypothetical protein WY02_15370 [Pseudonocardia sp. AL041005-10]
MREGHRVVDRLSSELLGFDADARVLLVNADDLGMHSAINEAIFACLDDGVVCSTSLMTVCPGTSHALQLLRCRPATAVGVHLTLVRDHVDDEWRPAAPLDRVRSLVDDSGRFRVQTARDEAVREMRIGEVELEFREQLKSAVSAGVHPTHLDFHCLADGGRPDILEVAASLAAEHGLALRVWTEPALSRARSVGQPVIDHPFLDSYALDPATKQGQYETLLRDLPVGLTEWAVHPAAKDAGMASLDPSSWRVRTSDLDFLISPRARQIIREEEITLIGYDTVRSVWRACSYI